MPRGTRELSEQGFYHVIMRGTGKQVIFEDEGDYEAFLWTLRRALERFSLSDGGTSGTSSPRGSRALPYGPTRSCSSR